VFGSGRGTGRTCTYAGIPLSTLGSGGLMPGSRTRPRISAADASVPHVPTVASRATNHRRHDIFLCDGGCGAWPNPRCAGMPGEVGCGRTMEAREGRRGRMRCRARSRAARGTPCGRARAVSPVRPSRLLRRPASRFRPLGEGARAMWGQTPPPRRRIDPGRPEIPPCHPPSPSARASTCRTIPPRAGILSLLRSVEGAAFSDFFDQGPGNLPISGNPSGKEGRAILPSGGAGGPLPAPGPLSIGRYTSRPANRSPSPPLPPSCPPQAWR